MARRTFNLKLILEQARSGKLSKADIRKAIKVAEDLGKTQIANELRLLVVQPAEFAGDGAPPEVRKRVALGVSALKSMGEPLTRTTPMLQKHGVIGTLNRIGRNPASSKNFEKLRAAGLEHLTAEAIILDYPEHFDSKAIAVARKRLAR